MARLLAKHLPHRIRTRSLIESAEGEAWSEWSDERPAYVEQKTRLVVDRRSTSPTFGQEVTSTTRIILLPTGDVLPRMQVEVFPGAPRSRISEVIVSAWFDYPRTPSHIEVDVE